MASNFFLAFHASAFDTFYPATSKKHFLLLIFDTIFGTFSLSNFQWHPASNSKGLHGIPAHLALSAFCIPHSIGNSR
jgi:hypothetical protein